MDVNYWQIVSELDYLKFAFRQQAEYITKRKQRSPLDIMIDKATGYDIAKNAEDKRLLIRTLCRIAYRQRKLARTEGFETTMAMIAEINLAS